VARDANPISVLTSPFYFYFHGTHRPLLSFPTRRSSDLASVSASAFATASVPCAKFGISKQPIGPFHTTVLASFTASQKIFSVSRSEEHTSELQSRFDLVCRLLLEKKKSNAHFIPIYGNV